VRQVRQDLSYKVTYPPYLVDVKRERDGRGERREERGERREKREEKKESLDRR
jgi:hypothetical protein